MKKAISEEGINLLAVLALAVAVIAVIVFVGRGLLG